MTNKIAVQLPITKEVASTLHVGDEVLLSGPAFTMRDAGHMRALEYLKEHGELPDCLKGALLFYAGPTPEPKEGEIGSVGPTTASRMDFAAPTLFANGVAAAMGKGKRSPAIAASCKETGAVCFSALGGAAAYLANCIISSEVLMWEDLGCEALRKMQFKNFPAIVTADTFGNDFYYPQKEVANKNSRSGKLITFEGVDGAGKSTHIALLANRLRAKGFNVVMVREPGGTELSEEVRNLLLNRSTINITPKAELLLFEVARAQLIRETIEPALNDGAVVLCDRFTDSTIAYQGYARGIDVESIRALNDFATNDIHPDRTLFLTAEANLAFARATKSGADRLEQEGISFQQRVRDGFESEIANSNGRMVTVKVASSKDETAKRIDAALIDLFPCLGE